ncbi:MAG: hypothetical protein KKH12_03300 [Gammaproteobacteria bacterium]|nr:hypothetical protein [Gammaproteobacteria bacterium]MBU1480681.1 hypothetical protein [Gammaproteobacteria bacterium]
MNEQSYIIRIYRSAIRSEQVRRISDAIALDGIVESPVSGEHHAFHDAEELWDILSRQQSGLGGKSVNKSRNKR